MKNTAGIILLLSVFLLFSCANHLSTKEGYMVDIVSRENRPIGKGVLIDNHTILTNAHVVPYLSGQRVVLHDRKTGKDYREIDSVRTETGKDLVYLEVGNIPHAPKKNIFVTNTEKDDLIYALVDRSGSILRVEGKILNTDVTYIGYDSTLSGILYTGAIVSDIVLFPGESGTPVWKEETGELIGVMSAIDSTNHTSYIVQ